MAGQDFRPFDIDHATPAAVVDDERNLAFTLADGFPFVLGAAFLFHLKAIPQARQMGEMGKQRREVERLAVAVEDVDEFKLFPALTSVFKYDGHFQRAAFFTADDFVVKIIVALFDFFVVCEAAANDIVSIFEYWFQPVFGGVIIWHGESACGQVV